MNENIKYKIEQMTSKLLSLARSISINDVSSNIFYFVRFIETIDHVKSFEENRKEQREIYESGNFINLEELVLNIERYQKKLSWIDLNLYFSSSEKTVILVEYIFKKRTFCFFPQKQNLNYHIGIMLPPFYKEGEKINLNWQYEKYSS